jgi:predicted signal transduction protein with EAL and GGDEF domain
MATTAEGVETKEQLELLRSEGCTEVQGYLFSPPRPASEIPALLEQLSPRHAGSGKAGLQAPRKTEAAPILQSYG